MRTPEEFQALISLVDPLRPRLKEIYDRSSDISNKVKFALLTPSVLLTLVAVINMSNDDGVNYALYSFIYSFIILCLTEFYNHLVDFNNASRAFEYIDSNQLVAKEVKDMKLYNHYVETSNDLDFLDAEIDVLLLSNHRTRLNNIRKYFLLFTTSPYVVLAATSLWNTFNDHAGNADLLLDDSNMNLLVSISPVFIGFVLFAKLHTKIFNNYSAVWNDESIALIVGEYNPDLKSRVTHVAFEGEEGGITEAVVSGGFSEYVDQDTGVVLSFEDESVLTEEEKEEEIKKI